MTDTDIEQVIFGQADLTSCDREPIHIPASIQPAGCVMAFSDTDHRLIRFSDNAPASMDVPSLRLGMSIEDCVGPAAAATILALAASETFGPPAISFDVEFPLNQHRDIAVHHRASNVVVEFEAITPVRLHASLAAQQRAAVERLRNPSDTTTLLRDAAITLRQTFGYDRVMVYRFAPDWSGQVIVEDRRDGLESFLGQHFPGSDIPAQARELYKRSLIRVICDATYQPVALTEEPGLPPLDMSFMHLRAVSPIHCEYLTNMGVRASMSVSLIVDGELWGLIACHHYNPRPLFMAERIAAKMIGEFISLQIVALNRSRRLSLTQAAHHFLSRLLRDATGTNGLAHYARSHLPDLLKIVPCDGGGIWTDQKWSATGLTLPETDIRKLLSLTGTVARNQIWHSDCLTRDCPDLALSLPDISGAIIIPVWPEQDDCLILFRREIIQTVVWGGDPAKTYSTGPHGARLTPRRSFEIWTEEVRHHSAHWSDDDLELAALFRSALMEVAARSSQRKLLERIQAESTQRMLNDELNHRVKNLLAVVQSLVSRVPAVQDSATDYRNTLQGRIRALANAHDLAVGAEAGTSLHDLLTTDLAPYNSSKGQITLTGPHIRLTERAVTFLALLFHELTTNAVKYGALSVPSGQLAVTWEHAGLAGTCTIHWQERNGPVVSPPERSGFGSLLIERAIRHDLKGTATRSFNPDGVTVVVCLPASTIIDQPPAGEHKPEQKKDRLRTGQIPFNALKGRNILVLEDEFLVAMDLEETLQSENAATVCVAPTIQAALTILKTHPIDLAILDVNVDGETSLPVAYLLTERAIPFLFATGYGKGTSVTDAFPAAPVIEKPYATTEAVTALSLLANQEP
ncbi:HWE histidine kinase domain-containing protein [Acetobacter fallax]|uniref:histidine kinase n=1 Tax=Acetobacter fallax TaxID=1737473 RepID=A0ABX0K8X5_9PROT|nr:HWE histidine kinase domain-containing protein [Acetobacter fallax]NHO31421.1 GAF domain-containing protein [Acetobacter fallax]NHO34995.1 GAF domain-containing protein [Acetobacter fallax]